jgi:hypothetical protein
MAKKRKKTIKIEIPVPEVRKPQAKDLDKIKKSLPGKVEELKTYVPRNEKAEKFVRDNRNLLIAAVVVVAAMIVTSFMISYFPPAEEQPDAGPRLVNRTKTVMVTVPVNISNEEYIDNIVNYEDQTITVTGFLQKGIKWGQGGGGMGTYTYSVLDDFDNEINLTDLTTREKSFFVEDGATAELYNVTGKVLLKYAGFDLSVSDIVPTTRPTTQVERQIVVEEYV